jgi:uncharacterized protein YndB with AHSA1/START domain
LPDIAYISDSCYVPDMSDVTSPTGALSTTDGRRRLVFRRVLPDPVDAVWSAVTESERLGLWFGTYTGTGRVGETVKLVMTAAEDAGGPPSSVAILECVPPERLVVEVADAGASEPWRMSVTLSPEGDGTVLVFDQLVPAGMRPADVGPGWHWYLDRLAASLGDAPMPAWGAYADLGELYPDA